MPPPVHRRLTRSTSSDGSQQGPLRRSTCHPSRLGPASPQARRRRIPLRHRDTEPLVPTLATVISSLEEPCFESLPPKSQWIEEHELVDALEDDDASDITIVPEFTALDLSDSGFNCIPLGLFAEADCFFQIQTLNLSNNQFDSRLDQYIDETLALPQLTSLYLRSCNMSCMEPLVRHLRAPNLKELDISTHQLTGFVPRFRQYFPRLERLLASKGGFEWVDRRAIKGLRLLDLTDNLVKDHDGKLRGMCARMGTRILL